LKSDYDRINIANWKYKVFLRELIFRIMQLTQLAYKSFSLPHVAYSFSKNSYDILCTCIEKTVDKNYFSIMNFFVKITKKFPTFVN
jgi:hypothetical protein